MDIKMLTRQSQGTPNLNDFKTLMLMRMAVAVQQHLAHYNMQF